MHPDEHDVPRLRNEQAEQDPHELSEGRELVSAWDGKVSLLKVYDREQSELFELNVPEGTPINDLSDRKPRAMQTPVISTNAWSGNWFLWIAMLFFVTAAVVVMVRNRRSA